MLICPRSLVQALRAAAANWHDLRHDRAHVRHRWPNTSVDLPRDTVGSGQNIGGFIDSKSTGLPVAMHPHLHSRLESRLNCLKTAKTIKAI